MAKRAEKVKFERYPHINLVSFILETTGRPGYHAKKFVSNLMKDADSPPFAIRDTRSAIQSVLDSAISKQQLTATATQRFAQAFPAFRAHSSTSLQPSVSRCKYR